MSALRWTATEALPGREHPEASEAPSGRIEAGSELVELERLGLWVRVETPQGERLWVDGRRLTEVVSADDPADPPPQEEAPPVEPIPTPPPPPVQPAASVWTATHTVPPEGLQAWGQPDPTGAVAANLAGGVELRVEERRADWAHVVAENGWQGWVDGRRLIAAQTVTPPPPQAVPAAAPVAAKGGKTVPTTKISFTLRTVAAVALAISFLLPWFGSWFGYAAPSSFDLPAAFLWSQDADLDFPNIGVVMLIVGLAVLASEFVEQLERYRLIAAGVAVAVAGVWLIQTFRLFLDYESAFTTAVSTMFTEGFALGPWVALAAGIVLIVKRQDAT